MNMRNLFAQKRVTACAITLGLIAFTNVAYARSASDFDVFGSQPLLGILSGIQHQVKQWNSEAAQNLDVDDAVFNYAESEPVVTLEAITTASKPSPDLAVTTQVMPAVLTSEALIASMLTMPTAKPDLIDTGNDARTVRGILDLYAEKRIKPEVAVALLERILQDKAHSNAKSSLPAVSSASASVAPPAVGLAVQSWTVTSHSTLLDTLTAWAHVAGWKAPKWKASNSYQIVGSTQINGSFLDALRALANAVPQIDITASMDHRELIVTDAAQ